jgi:hypothetical protein
MTKTDPFDVGNLQLDPATFPVPPVPTKIQKRRQQFAMVPGRKPTTLEAAAVQRAANLTAIAEFALANPSISLTDLVRLDHSAERARAAMAATLAKARNTVPTLEELGVAI